MTALQKWEEILKRDDLVGGDLETVEDRVPYRCPIDKILMDNGLVRIESSWCARLDPKTGAWKVWQNPPFYINAELISPQVISDGRIHFSMPMLGYATIFPKGGSKLDPAKVEGLRLELTA